MDGVRNKETTIASLCSMEKSSAVTFNLLNCFQAIKLLLHCREVIDRSGHCGQLKLFAADLF